MKASVYNELKTSNSALLYLWSVFCSTAREDRPFDLVTRAAEEDGKRVVRLRLIIEFKTQMDKAIQSDYNLDNGNGKTVLEPLVNDVLNFIYDFWEFAKETVDSWTGELGADFYLLFDVEKVDAAAASLKKIALQLFAWYHSSKWLNFVEQQQPTEEKVEEEQGVVVNDVDA